MVSRDIDEPRKYVRGPLKRADLDPDPFVQFQEWFEEACERVPIEPHAMSLATTDGSGAPDVRMVLMKYFDREGFVFFTNLASRKATQIDGNPNVALMFWWPVLERQVRIVAGFLTLVGAVLGFFVNPYFIGLSAFIGAGLMFAGITDTCGMGMMLAKMPWNR